MTPAAAPAYTGPLTWDDTGWRCCRLCEVEWMGDAGCFLNAGHRGLRGRLRSWCRHGLRKVMTDGDLVCPWCESHSAADFTPEFLDVFSLAADRVLRSIRPETVREP